MATSLSFQLSAWFHYQLPLEVLLFAVQSHVAILFFWFEPLALRLNLLRGLGWLGLRIATYAPLVLLDRDETGRINACALLIFSTLAISVLRGWRSRAWMSPLGGMLMAGATYFYAQSGSWVSLPSWPPLVTLPYGVVLLFGTRLLRPEERVRNST